MTVVRPNSISGINSITVATGSALNVHDADGNVINTITGASGVATYRGIHVGAGTTTSDQGISVGTGASIVSDAVNQLSVYTNNTERVQVRSDGKSVISETGTLTPLSLLTLRGTAGCEITLVGASANDQGVYFNDGSNSGAVIYDHNTDKMSFRINANKNVTIDSLGSLSVGTGGTVFQNGNIAAAGIVTATSIISTNDLKTTAGTVNVKSGTSINTNSDTAAHGALHKNVNSGEFAIVSGGTGGDNYMAFYTSSSGAPSEKLRITAEGRLKLTGSSESNITTQAATAGGTTTIDMDTSDNWIITMGGNTTIGDPSNEKLGQTGSIWLVQDGTGSRTAAWNSAFKWVGGTAPTLTTTASMIDRVDYIVKAAGEINAVISLDVK